MTMLARRALLAVLAVALGGTGGACSSFGDADGAGAAGEGGAPDAAVDPFREGGSEVDSPREGGSAGACELLAPGSAEIFAAKEDAPSFVTADAVNVYWARSGPAGGVRRKNVNGLDQASDFHQAAGMIGLALTLDYVVYQYGLGTYAKSKDAPGAVPIEIYPYTDSLAVVAMGANEVAWTRSSGIVYRSVQLAGAHHDLADEQNGAFALAYAASSVSFLAPAGVGIGVFSCAVTGPCNQTPSQPLAVAGSGPVAIAADASHIYWADAELGRVRRVARAAGSGVEEVISGLVSPRYIAVDDTHVYVAMRTGGIARASKTAKSSCVVAPAGQDVVTSMALAGAWVYFTDPTSVRRLAK